MINFLNKGMIMKKLLAAVLVSVFIMVQGCSTINEVRTLSPDGKLEFSVESNSRKSGTNGDSHIENVPNRTNKNGISVPTTLSMLWLRFSHQ